MFGSRPQQHRAGDLVVEAALVGVPHDRGDHDDEQQRAHDRAPRTHPAAREGHDAHPEEAVADAEGVLAAWEAGAGAGVVTHNGRMVEALHVETAERVLAVHRAIRELEDQRAG